MRAILRGVLEVDAAADADLCATRLREESSRSRPDARPVDPAARHPARPRPAGDTRDRGSRRAVPARAPGRGRDRNSCRQPRRVPTILVIEDAHHIDEATRDLLVRSGDAEHGARHCWSSPGRWPDLRAEEDEVPPSVTVRLAAHRGAHARSSTSSPRTSRSSPTTSRRSRDAPAATRSSCSSCSTPSGRPGRSNRSPTRSSR